MDSNGFLFDGFPRTFIQAYILDGLMIKMQTKLNCLINIELTEKEAIKRLLLRGVNSGRSDDSEIIINTRLAEYVQKTLPVIDYYKEKNIYHSINGMQSIRAVKNDISKILNAEQEKSLFNIIIFGYPGSGRSTIGRKIAEKYDLKFISTECMLNEEIQNKTLIGKKIKNTYEKRQLVPDEIIIKLIENKIKNSGKTKGFIFKGYPRTFVQSYILDGVLKKYGTFLSQVIELKVPTLEIIKRLDKRRQTKNCKSYDTNTEKIVARIEEHEEKTCPVINKYKNIRSVITINGNSNVETVFENVCTEIDKMLHI